MMRNKPLGPAELQVLAIADVVGYGNLIALLRGVWVYRLMTALHIDRDIAEETTAMPPYPQEWVKAWLEEVPR